MRRRTLIFLILAIVMTPIAIVIHHEETVLCPDAATLILKHPQQAPQPKLLRVQANENDGDEQPEQPAPRAATPCERSNISALAKGSLYVSVALWVGFVGLLRSDVRRKKMRARRIRRQSRTRYVQPGDERAPASPPNNVEQ